MVYPSVETYVQNQEDLTEEFAELVRSTGTKYLGCDSECLYSCTNSTYITFWEVPQCLEFCDCDLTPVLDISAGRYNYVSLMAYNKGNLEAWSLFKRFQHKI